MWLKIRNKCIYIFLLYRLYFTNFWCGLFKHLICTKLIVLLIVLSFFFSLRSLCKTLLNNTNPATASACDRAKVLVEILSKVCPESNSNNIEASKILSVASSVKLEQEEVLHLKNVLNTQGTLRPIFEGQLKQKRAIREHALGLRKLVAEAGLNYEDLKILYSAKNSSSSSSENNDDEQNHSNSTTESRTNTLKMRLDDAVSDKDLEDLIKLLDKHFIKEQSDSNH